MIRRTGWTLGLLLLACGDGEEFPSRYEYEQALSTPADSVRRAARDQPADTAVADASAQPREPAPATPQPPPRAASPDTGWTAGIREGGSDGPPTGTQATVRFGRHEGYDRVVFEFAERVPKYHIEYIDRPVRACASGHVVPLAGDGWLEVRFEDARAHDDEGRSTVEARSYAPRLPVVLEARLTCDFEAVLTWVLGVAAPNRYRVLELREPPRLVVDVSH